MSKMACVFCIAAKQFLLKVLFLQGQMGLLLLSVPCITFTVGPIGLGCEDCL